MKCTILKIRTVAEWWRFSLQFLWRKHSIFCKRLIYRCDTHPFVCSMSRQFFRFQFSLIYFLTYVKGSITAWAWARTRTETTFFPLHTHTLTMWPSANAFLLNILFIYLFLDFSFFFLLLFFGLGFMFALNRARHCLLRMKIYEEFMLSTNGMDSIGLQESIQLVAFTMHLHLHRMPIMPWWRFDFSIYCPENGMR